MPNIISTKKRCVLPTYVEPGSNFVVINIEGLECVLPTIGTAWKGKTEHFEVFDRNTLYSGGITLAKPVRMSGNNLYVPPIVVKTTGTWPLAGKDWLTSGFTSPVYWICKAIDQTTAMTAAKQYRVDMPSNPNKLRLTLEGTSPEPTTDLTGILAVGEYLVVIYPIPTANIDWEAL